MKSGKSRDLVHIASDLQHAAATGSAWLPLRGKHLGMLSQTDGNAAAALFYRAAATLGAHVSHIKPTLSVFSAQDDVQRTALWLGQLYDGVECQGMPGVLVRTLARNAGIPFFNGLALPSHPTARLSKTLALNASADEKRCLIVQAVLLDSLC